MSLAYETSYPQVWADFYTVLEVVYITYNMGTRDLLDIYARVITIIYYSYVELLTSKMAVLGCVLPVLDLL